MIFLSISILLAAGWVALALDRIGEVLRDFDEDDDE